MISSTRCPSDPVSGSLRSPTTSSVRVRFGQAGAAARSLLGGGARRGAAVLAYHDVTLAAEGPHHVTPELFRAHLRVVRDRGWTFAPVAAIVDKLERGDSVDGLAAITFDDAWQGLPDHALPHLVEESVPATIFVITDRRDPTKYMVESQLRDALASGVTLASHTRTHPSLPELDDDALRDELLGSRDVLCERFGVDADLLAYPRGHVDRRVRDATADAGYRAAFTYFNGKAAPSADLMLLPRFTMGPHQTPRRLAYHLARGPGAWPDPFAARVV